eukprot:scaffold1624_cov105-Cylindrotheca_fusiformis.AAC.4
MAIENATETCEADPGILSRTGSWLGQHPFFQVSLGLTVVGAAVILRYRLIIRKRLKQMEQRYQKGLVYRDASKLSDPPRIRFLELDPSLVHKDRNGNSCRMMSLGQYLSQLRVIEDEDDTVNKGTPDILKKEFQAFLGSYLLSTLGPRIGPAVLPLMGISKVDSWLTSFAGSIASWIAAHIVMGKIQDKENNPIDYDVAGTIPFTIGEIVNLTNINQKMTSYGSSNEVTALEKMKQGETTYSIKFDPDAVDRNEESSGTPEEKHAFNSPDEDKEDLIPSPFIVDDHLKQAILKMEAKIKSSENEDYDPEDRSFPPPTPLNKRLLPDLHVGWGSAKCSHSKREILLNRLVSVLLNKLSYNYYLVENGATPESLFSVHLGGEQCQFPDEFIQALLDTKHKIEVCPRSTVTTFGFGVCVKEEDESFTNIPLGLFLRTGLEGQNGDPLFFGAKHGGMDLSIRGPLIDNIIESKDQKPGKCDVQFYVSLDGMCCWNSNHNPEVPWIDQVPTSPVYSETEALAAVRTTGLLAVAFNAIATEMNLPFGGYGILGVCNDSAALVDVAIRKETNLYPLISTERYLWHTVRRLVRLQTSLEEADSKTSHDLKPALTDIRNLVSAASNMESDIHSNPSKLQNAKRRYDVSYPTSIFRLTSKSKEMLQSESDKYQKYINPM